MPSAASRLARLVRFALAAYGTCALPLLLLVPRFALPAEDATILFHYSRNLALHGAILFNVPGPHVEGATDFLWMVLLAAALRLGVEPFVMCAVVNVAALLGLAALLLRMGHRRTRPVTVLAVAGTGALLPQIFAAASGFAVLPDALLLLTLCFAVLHRRPWLSSGSALLLCLFRPDGVVFAVPLLLWLALTAPSRRHTLVAIGSAFVLPGIAYFFWRWHYFAEPLPLPFLVKSDAPRHFGFLVAGSFHAAIPALAFLAAILAALFWRQPRNRRPDLRATTALLLCLVVVPTLFYSSMRLDQNVSNRFFFYLPLAAAVLVALGWHGAPQTRLTLTAGLAWLVCFFPPFVRELRTTRDLQFTTVHRIGLGLAGSPHSATMLVTEAGFLPYDSGWQAIDAWGLNTPHFAHHFVQPEDVTRLAPDLIVVHPDLQDSCLPDSTHPESFPDRSWPHMTHNLVTAAAAGGYQLWLVSYGSDYYRLRRHWRYGEGDRECWYLKPNTPALDGVAEILMQHHAIPPGLSQALEASHPDSLRR